MWHRITWKVMEGKKDQSFKVTSWSQSSCFFGLRWQSWLRKTGENLCKDRQSSPPPLFISIWSRILIKEEKTRTVERSLYQTLGHLFKRKIVSWGFCSVILCLFLEHLLKGHQVMSQEVDEAKRETSPTTAKQQSTPRKEGSEMEREKLAITKDCDTKILLR